MVQSAFYPWHVYLSCCSRAVPLIQLLHHSVSSADDVIAADLVERDGRWVLCFGGPARLKFSSVSSFAVNLFFSPF
jgi:hypothetical protein